MRRHELDPLSLVFGVLLTAAGLLLAAGRLEIAVRLRWLWPMLLLGLGAAILVGARPRRPASVAGARAAELPDADAGPEGPPPEPASGGQHPLLGAGDVGEGADERG
jgi:hypothetical protein